MKKFSGIKAIIFDKDGTLIDFDKFWVSVSQRAIELIYEALGITYDAATSDEIMAAFGVRDGVTDIDGVLCKGTYRQMSDIVFDILTKHGAVLDREALYSKLLSAYVSATDAGVIAPTAKNLREALMELRSSGIRLAVVTTDNFEITKKCLDGLGITELFDKLYCDDGIMPTKPNPAAIADLCERFGIGRESVIMVGDTMTDVRFARAGGIGAVGVSHNPKNIERLATADAVLYDVSELHTVIEV